MLKGIYTALVTPLKEGTVDLGALEKLVERQLEAGVHGLAICATTGEGAALTQEERRKVIEAVLGQVGGRIQIVVGTGYTTTRETIAATRIAADLGADAALVSSPAYLKPSQAGIAAHYESVADEVGLPVIAYNVPSRTSSDVLPATLGRLAEHEKIVGVKEATGSIHRVQQVIAAVNGKMDVLSGDDPITVSLLVAGGQGVICTGSNVVPWLWTELWRAWEGGDVAGAAAVQARLLGLHDALFSESNPGPAKGALNLLGLIEPEIRAPLTWPTEATISRLAAELDLLGCRAAGSR